MVALPLSFGKQQTVLSQLELCKNYNNNSKFEYSITATADQGWALF